MKKIVTVFLAVVALSLGGKMAHANAAELTPSQTAAMQAQLNSLEAQFVQLEVEASAGAPVTTPAVTPVAAISSENAADLNEALTALTGVLSQLQSGNTGPATLSALSDIGNTLALIETSLAATPVAVAQPAHASPAPVAVTSPKGKGNGSGVAATTPAPQGSLAPSSANTVPATAQISASWTQRELPWIVIGIVIVLIIVLMVWLSRRDKRDLQSATTMPSQATQPAEEERKPA